MDASDVMEKLIEDRIDDNCGNQSINYSDIIQRGEMGPILDTDLITVLKN